MTNAPEQRKRALFVINSLSPGGAERVMCTLLAASEAERAEFDIELVLLDRVPPMYAPPPWVTVRQLDCKYSMPLSVMALRQTFARLRPDIVLSFLSRSNVASVVAARTLGIPCVISERVQNSAHLGKGLSASVAKQLIRVAYPQAERIIAVSSGVAQDLETAFRVPAAKVIAIENPVDIASIEAAARESAPVSVDRPYIVGVGRLTSVKNFALLIEAFANANYPGKLLILGEGPERPNLEQRISALGLQDRVILGGHVGNPFPLVRGADFFAAPSNAEGFPNAMVEAMALGIPVIAANCPSGPSEILAGCEREAITGLTEGASGILTPMNDVASLTRAINMLVDPQARAAWSSKARARAAEYSVARAKDRYWAVLREAMASRRSPGRDTRR